MLLIFLLFVGFSAAALNFAKVLQSNMVLQRDVTAHLWGDGVGNITIKINETGEIYTTSSASNGTNKVFRT